jgi:hypothetical protein
VSNQWLVSHLIRNLKLRQLIVTSDDASEGFGVSDFLMLANDVIRSTIVPLLKRTREDYLLTREDLDIVSGTDRYSLPTRAAAETLKAILYDAGDGRWLPLERTSEEKAAEFSASEGRPFGYYLQDDSVVFVPEPSEANTVRFLYFGRPNRLVDVDEVGQISAINTGTGAVTFLGWDADPDDPDYTTTTAPAGFAAGATSYDFVKGTPGFRNRATAKSATRASNVLTFAPGDLPDGLAVGDFVCLAGETPIPQIPDTLHSLLSQEVSRTILESKGDKRTQQAEKTADKMQANAETMLSNRVQATPKYLTNPNAGGMSRAKRRWWR